MSEKVVKPWGHFETLAQGKNWKLKILTIKPGQAISLQRHLDRSEVWDVVQGTPMIFIGGSSFYPSQADIQSGFATYLIEPKIVHRIINIGSDDVVIMETQHGSCKEEDIERLEDLYGR